MIIKYLILWIILTIFYSVIVYNNYVPKIKHSKQYLFYIILNIILYFIICNVIILLLFYNKIINKKGPMGNVGERGEIGKIGKKGICDIKCTDKQCKYKFMEAMEEEFNRLLKIEFQNDIRIKKAI